MYRPPYTKNEKLDLAWNLIQDYPLGLLISHNEQKIETNYLPFLVIQEGQNTFLFSHLAKSNPQWKHLTGDVLVSFQGPQKYISPTIYKNKINVPTWNYAVVQIQGTAETFSDSQSLKELLNRSVEFFESKNGTNWSYKLPAPAQMQLEAAIIGVKIKVHQVESKFKLSQNRSDEDHEEVLQFMQNSAKEKDREMFNWMIKSRL